MRSYVCWLYLLISLIFGANGDSIKKCNFTTDLSNYNDNRIQKEKIEISVDNMLHEKNCWYIVKFSSKYGVKILFDDFDLQDVECGLKNDECCQYLEIGIGSKLGENLVKKLCGHDRYFEPIYIQNNEIWFNFINNNNNYSLKSYRGFNATITPFQLIYKNLMDKIKCPNYDESISIYPNKIDLTFKIDVPEKYLILVNFNSIDLEKFNDTCYDFLQIIESNQDHLTNQLKDPKLSERIICGKQPPNNYISSSNQLKLRFRSDENITGDLFDINYKTIQSKFLFLKNSI